MSFLTQEESGQEELRSQFMISLQLELEETFKRIFIRYLRTYCGETLQEERANCPFINDLIRDIQSSSIDYFALPPPFNEQEVLRGQLDNAFLQHLDRYCSGQEDVPEECSTVIAKHIQTLFFSDNIMFIGLTLTVAHKIVLSRIYLGETIDEMDFSPFNLTVHQSAYNPEETCGTFSSLPQEFEENSGILSLKKNEHQYGEDECYYDIQLNPLFFEEAQFFVKTSENSDESLIQLVFYLILDRYYNSLFYIQSLKGEETINLNPPDISFLPRDTPFAISASIEERFRKERQEDLRVRERQNDLEGTFRAALKIAYRQLTTERSYDELMNHTSIRFFTDEFWSHLENTVGAPISDDLKENVYKAEYSLNLDFNVNNIIEFGIDDSSESFYCTSCEIQTLENYRGSRYGELISLISRVYASTIMPLFQKNGDVELTSVVAENYRSLEEYLAGTGQQADIHPIFLEGIERFTDQWIERALEVMPSLAFVSPQQMLAQLEHQEYVEKIIQAANRISMVDNNHLSTLALYETVRYQKDFPVHSRVSRQLSNMFLNASSYTDARRTFNEGLKDLSLLIGLKNEDIDPIFFGTDLLSSGIDQTVSESILDKSTEESANQGPSENVVDEPVEEPLDLAEQIRRLIWGVDDENANRVTVSALDETNEETDQMTSENNLDESTEGTAVLIDEEDIRRFLFGHDGEPKQEDEAVSEPKEDSDVEEQTNEETAHQVVSESILDESAKSPAGLTDEQIGRAVFGVDDGLTEENIRQEITFPTIAQRYPKAVINPNHLIDALNTVSPPVVDDILVQRSIEQKMASYKADIIYLLIVGEDMGFFDDSLVPERRNGRELRDIIFSRLGDPQRGFLDPCKYFSLTACDSSEVYLDVYKENQKNEILNRHRILSDRYSPEEGKPLFEIIRDSCGPEIDRQTCRSHVSRLVIDALEKQEQELESDFQELISHLANEDPSEALEKVRFALEENTESEGGAFFTNISLILDEEEAYRVQFDFHKQRLQEHLTPSEDEKFWQNYVYTPMDNMLSTLFLMWIPSFTKGILGGSAGVLGRGSASRQMALHQLASRNSRGLLMSAVFFPAFGSRLYRNVVDYNNHISPRAEFIEDLYYISPDTGLLVDQAQLLASEELKTRSRREAITYPVVMIAALLGFGVVYRGLRIWRSRSLLKQVNALEGHFNKLGIRGNAWWDMRGVETHVESLRASTSLFQRWSINRSWRAIEKFHDRKVREAKRLMGLRKQLGVPNTEQVNITTPDAMVTFTRSQYGNIRHLDNLQRTLQRQEDLFGLHKYKDNHLVQSFFEYLKTLSYK